VDVVLTADSLAPASVADATVLVIDVLRASTTIVTALIHGCRALIPVTDAVEARRRAEALGGEPPPLLAGERRGETIAGFDLGNSPVEVAAAAIRGRTILLTTSNGTRALLAARGAHAIGVAGFINRSAAARWAGSQRRPVVLVCAGERGGVSLEDQACAGLLAAHLVAEVSATQLTEAAREAVEVGRGYRGEVGRLRADSAWARHLVQTGRGADVDVCLALDTATLVPVYRPDVDEIVAGRG
jgi:2-phosphosulfolactate phosphatase